MQNKELLSRLEGELKLPPAKRDTGASDVSLNSVISLLQRADKLAGASQPSTAEAILDAAARQVSDSWSFSSVLGAEVFDFIEAVKRRLP